MFKFGDRDRKTYVRDMVCSNCDWGGGIDIPKGKLLSDAMRNLKCPECGCTTLKDFKEKSESEQDWS